MNDFLASGIIKEAESIVSRSGRPPVVLEIDQTRGHVVGIDIGASHISLLVTDMAAHIIEEIEAPLDIQDGPKICLGQADQLLQEALAKTKLDIKDILAVGVGVPGPIVSDAGMVLAPPIMPGWDRFPIRDTLEEKWRIPVSLNNDAELGALGEWAAGAGRGENNLAYIKVGTGIGCGLLIDGKIYHGLTGSAGEIGHLTIDENGPLCACGNHGCLEAFAGGRAIAEQAMESIKSGRNTRLASFQSNGVITAQQVGAAARHGDLVAQQILSQAGAHIGIAIAGLVNLFNPGMVIIGGGVSQNGDIVLEPIRQVVNRRSLPAATRVVHITTAMLGRRSSSIGAIIQALTIALHQIANRKEVISTSAARKKSRRLDDTKQVSAFKKGTTPDGQVPGNSIV